MAEVVLNSPPSDGISSVRFDDSKNLLVAASWDSTVRVYDTDANALKSSWKHKAPVLDATFLSPDVVASAGLDREVKLYDVASSTTTVLGKHEAPVRTLDYSEDLNLLLSGSWDRTVKAWDPRAPGDEAMLIAAPDKVYTATLAHTYTYIIGTAGRQVQIHDLRKLGGADDSLLYSRESNLKHQSRCIRAFTDGSGYITSSIEGRCSVEWVDPGENAKKYSFKCHRHKLGGGDERIFPVNALAFHPVYGSFVTGGGDGNVFSWDYKGKKRLAQLKTEAPTSISSLAYNANGTQLAVAVSYSWEQGEREHPSDSIIIVKVTEAQVKPKEKA